jgi:16S rRNA (guanine966-N2)-methyltransferase
MRVVAGELKGRKLISPPRGAEIRPTSDKVREALFSILGEIEGFQVLDLYCGTGALGIEAISRGAAHAVLVDDDPIAAQRNIDSLGVHDRVTLVRADAGAYLRAEKARFEGGPFDLILCDPPYTLAPRLGPELTKLLPARLAPRGRIATESSVRAPLQLGLELERERTYGDTSVSIWTVQ